MPAAGVTGDHSHVTFDPTSIPLSLVRTLPPAAPWGIGLEAPKFMVLWLSCFGWWGVEGGDDQPAGLVL